MAVELHPVPAGRPAGERLAEVVAAAAAGAPLAPVTVVVASNFAGLAARRLLGSGTLAATGRGIANVAFVTPYRLAGLIADDALLDRSPLTDPVLGVAVRDVLAQLPGPLSEVRAHAATQRAVASLYAAVDNLGPAARAAVAEQGYDGRLAVDLHARIAERLTRYHGEAQLAEAAARHPDLAARVARLGHVVWYLPGRLTAPMGALLRAVFDVAPTSVVVGLTGDLDADAGVHAACALAGVELDAGDAGGPVVSADHLVSVTDADEEVRAAIRWLCHLAEHEGVALDRTAVLFPAPEPYLGLVEQQLAAAGLPANGPSRRRLRDSVAGRTLLGALALPADRWRRDRVLALVAGGPLRHGEHRVTPSAWEVISREAGVVADLADWDRKLGRHRATLQRRADEAAANDHPDAPHHRWALERAEQLASFVADLGARVGAVRDATGWHEAAERAGDLLGALVDLEAARRHWPDREHDALVSIQGALSRLAALDPLEALPSHEVFLDALTAELDAPQARVGRFGHGVLYGPLAAAAGLDLDAVVVLGCAEGMLPRRGRDTALLPDRVRGATGGELPTRTEALHEQHRHFLTALAAAPAGRRALTFARSDLRNNRHAIPSRWFLDSASARTADHRLVTADDLADLPDDVVHRIDSFAAGLLATDAYASVDDRDLAAAWAWVAAGGHPTDGHAAFAPVQRALSAQAARRSPSFTEWDGNVAGVPVAGPDDGAAWSPTRLQTWAQCGFRYFLQYVLGLRDRTDPEEIRGLDRLDRGSLLHETFERFIAEAIDAGPPRPNEPWTPEQRHRLFELLEEAFEVYERRGRTGRPLRWRIQQEDLREAALRFLEADDAHRAAHGAVPLRVEHVFGDEPPVSVELADGRRVRFKGIIDRVDVTDAGELVVSDYKSGKDAKYKVLAHDPVGAGTLLQLGVYAHAAQQTLQPGGARSQYWMLDVGGVHGYEWTPDRDERFRNVIGTIVEGIEAGVFAADPGEWDTYRNAYENCTWCAFDHLCPVDRGEQAERKHDAPQLTIRRRLEPPAEEAP